MPNAYIKAGTPDNFAELSMCGYSDLKNEGYADKVAWNTDMYKMGMRYNYLIGDNEKAIGGIEFMPVELSLRPVKAPKYLIINCLYIMKKPYKGQGYGSMLLSSCIDHARKHKFAGIAAIVRKGSWMAEKDLFIKHGFESAEKIKNGYELVYLKIDDNAATPGFDIAPVPEVFSSGLYVFHSCQCPYLKKAVDDISKIAAEEFKMTANVVNLDANNYPKFSPFGTFHIVHNGDLIAFHPISGTRFKNIMLKRV